MLKSCLADRIGELVTLTDAERAALAGLEQRERTLRRGTVLFRENDPAGDLYVVRAGLLMDHVVLDDGSRQILRFLFTGDMTGAASLAYPRSPETVMAVTDAVVCPFDRAALAAVIAAHPRLAAILLVLTQIERVAMTDRLAALGRTSAKARVAALLLEMRDAYRRTDPRIALEFTLGLTQEEVGDATGLTSVHVNRMLRQLEDERLIAREGGRLRILAEAALERSANYVDRYVGLDLSWLPAPARP